MRFRLLGPLEVIDVAGRWQPVAGPRQRILLAALLLHANTPVSVDQLAETVWDGVPPAGYAQTLRSHVMRLRRSLIDELGVEPGPEMARVHQSILCGDEPVFGRAA